MSDVFYLVSFRLSKHQTESLQFAYTSITIIQVSQSLRDSHFDISTVIQGLNITHQPEERSPYIQ